MKYFLDCEFIEGTQTKRLFGIPVGQGWKILDAPYKQTKSTIDLISIGIVSEDGREYYAISKDFNLKEAWNRYQIKERKDYENYPTNDRGNILYEKEYWLRDNVLEPIWYELSDKELHEDGHYDKDDWDYKEFKRLIKKYGKTNKQIAEEVIEFVNERFDGLNNQIEILQNNITPIEFCGYYSDYDWVVFCWLFGKMIDLPKGFPMYCIDLKQELDNVAKRMSSNWFEVEQENIFGINNYTKIKNPSFEQKLNLIKQFKNYPKQTNEHNALADAKWNYELYKFLNKL